jgi:putative SOS response-associated peptidase YedK
MCGRFALHTPRSRIASRYFNIQLPVGDVHASYNITPGVQITAVYATPEAPASFDFSHWGFRPPGQRKTHQRRSTSALRRQRRARTSGLRSPTGAA